MKALPPGTDEPASATSGGDFGVISRSEMQQDHANLSVEPIAIIF